MNIIFAGTIGRSGLGGQAWAALQYLLGFRALGHHVTYVEDCGESSWVWNWDTQEWTTELDYPANYVRSCLEPFGFGADWIYRTNEGCRGLALKDFLGRCREADLLLVRAVPLWVWRPEYDAPRRRGFLDVDPGFTQATLQAQDKGWQQGVARAERLFTYGQCVSRTDCLIPHTGHKWLATLPPVFVPEWPEQPLPDKEACYSSVIRWQGFREVTVEGKVFGQRDKQFAQHLGLPGKTGARFCVAMMGAEPSTLEKHGWSVLPGEVVSKTPDSYRAFIQKSRAEIAIPKHGYVEMRTGWVSDRSVCYLASGRPVVMEETGISEFLPRSEGLVTFRGSEEAVRAIKAVEANYEQHRIAARAVAEEVFSTALVLPRLINDCMS